MADSILARRRTKKAGGFNYSQLSRLCCNTVVSAEQKISTPEFLKKGAGVMCVSPVSPNNPLTPGRFFSEYVLKNDNLSSIPPPRRGAQPRNPIHTRQDMRLKAVKDAIVAVKRVSSSDTIVLGKKRGQLNRNATALKESSQNVKTALQGALETTELMDWMSKAQKQKVFACLEELSGLTHALFGGQISSKLHNGSEDLQIKSLLVELSGRYSKLHRQLESDAEVVLQAQVQLDSGKSATVADQIESLGADKLGRCCGLAYDVGRAFKDATLFAPVGALKALENGKKAVGEGMLRALGVKGLSISERLLDKKLQELFKEIDANKSGELDLDEVRQSLIKMGITMTDAALKAYMDKVDTNGNGVICFEEWKEYITSILTSNKVQVEQHEACTPEEPSPSHPPPIPPSAPAPSSSQKTPDASPWEAPHRVPPPHHPSTPPPAPPSHSACRGVRRLAALKPPAPSPFTPPPPSSPLPGPSPFAPRASSALQEPPSALAARSPWREEPRSPWREEAAACARKSPLRALADLPPPPPPLAHLNPAPPASPLPPFPSSPPLPPPHRFFGDDSLPCPAPGPGCAQASAEAGVPRRGTEEPSTREGEEEEERGGGAEEEGGVRSPGKRQRLLRQRLATTAVRRVALEAQGGGGALVEGAGRGCRGWRSEEEAQGRKHSTGGGKASEAKRASGGGGQSKGRGAAKRRMLPLKRL